MRQALVLADGDAVSAIAQSLIRAQVGAIGAEADRFGNEVNRAVDERKLAAAGMEAAEGETFGVGIAEAGIQRKCDRAGDARRMNRVTGRFGSA
ncbi:hypothetical protein C5Y93_12400 [Blastopirellula marina]|uniref:Uncharacterized protein n=1 Tax=Blastopirellula marina TaxID=124 RepID=A0A2S8GNY6_9BACT|nr:hypothetical protein C5Y93_12400 [Blastopirellula marina]